MAVCLASEPALGQIGIQNSEFRNQRLRLSESCVPSSELMSSQALAEGAISHPLFRNLFASQHPRVSALQDAGAAGRRAEIVLPLVLGEYTGRKNQVTVHGAVTLGDLFDQLIGTYQGLKKQFFDDEGNLRTFVAISLGDGGTLTGPWTILKQRLLPQAAEIRITSRIAGGSTNEESSTAALDELAEALKDSSRSPASVIDPHIDQILEEVQTLPDAERESFDAGSVIVGIGGIRLNFGVHVAGLVAAVSSRKAPWHESDNPRIRVLFSNSNPKDALIMVYQAGWISLYDTQTRIWSPRIRPKDNMIGAEKLYDVLPAETFIERTLIEHFGRPLIQAEIIHHPPFSRFYNADKGGEIAFDPIAFPLPKTAGTWSFLKERLFRLDEKQTHSKRYGVLVDAKDPGHYLFFLSTPKRVILYNQAGPIAAYDKTKAEARLARSNIYLDTFLQDLLNSQAPPVRKPVGSEIRGKGAPVVHVGGASGAILVLYHGGTYQVEAQDSKVFKALNTFGWARVRRILDGQGDALTDVYRVGENLLALEGVGDLNDSHQPVYLLYGDHIYLPHMTRQLGRLKLVTEKFLTAFGTAGRIISGAGTVVGEYKSTRSYVVVNTRRLVPVRTSSGRWVLRPMFVIVEKGSKWQETAKKHPDQITIPGVSADVQAAPPAPLSAAAIETKSKGKLAPTVLRTEGAGAKPTVDTERIFGPSKGAFQRADDHFIQGERLLVEGDLPGALTAFKRAETDANMAVYGGPSGTPMGYVHIADTTLDGQIKNLANSNIGVASELLLQIEARIPQTVGELAANVFKTLNDADDARLVVAQDTIEGLRTLAIERLKRNIVAAQPALLGYEQEVEDRIPALSLDLLVMEHSPVPKSSGKIGRAADRLNSAERTRDIIERVNKEAQAHYDIKVTIGSREELARRVDSETFRLLVDHSAGEARASAENPGASFGKGSEGSQARQARSNSQRLTAILVYLIKTDAKVHGFFAAEYPELAEKAGFNEHPAPPTEAERLIADYNHRLDILELPLNYKYSNEELERAASRLEGGLGNEENTKLIGLIMSPRFNALRASLKRNLHIVGVFFIIGILSTWLIAAGRVVHRVGYRSGLDVGRSYAARVYDVQFQLSPPAAIDRLANGNPEQIAQALRDLARAFDAERAANPNHIPSFLIRLANNPTAMGKIEYLFRHAAGNPQAVADAARVTPWLPPPALVPLLLAAFDGLEEIESPSSAAAQVYFDVLRKLTDGPGACDALLATLSLYASHPEQHQKVVGVALPRLLEALVRSPGHVVRGGPVDIVVDVLKGSLLESGSLPEIAIKILAFGDRDTVEPFLVQDRAILAKVAAGQVRTAASSAEINRRIDLINRVLTILHRNPIQRRVGFHTKPLLIERNVAVAA